MCFICFLKFFLNGMKFGSFFLVFLMEVFRGLWVNVFEMFGWLSGVSAFFVFERPVRALHAELAVEGEQRRVAVCSSRICSSFLLLLRVSCSKPPWALLFFLCAISASLPVLAYCLAHQWPVLYLCDISVLSMPSCARTGVCLVLSLCYLCDLVLGTGFCSVLSLCYLCAIYAISFYLCAISLIFLWNLCLYSLLSLSKAWHQELAVPNLMVPWSVGPKYVLSFWWSWGDSWSVHRLGLSNCMAVWSLEGIDKKKLHFLLERRARQTPKQVFLLIQHAHAASQKIQQKTKFNLTSPNLSSDFLLTFRKNKRFQLCSTYFYLFLLVSTYDYL